MYYFYFKHKASTYYCEFIINIGILCIVIFVFSIINRLRL